MQRRYSWELKNETQGFTYLQGGYSGELKSEIQGFTHTQAFTCTCGCSWEVKFDQMESTTEQSVDELWIPTLGLFGNDQQVLNSDRWLNDNIIYATERLLCQQSKDTNIYGWQSPQCVKTTFKAMPPSSKYIQVLNVHELHWITISNIDVREDKHCANVVSVYDSDSHARLSLSTKTQICSIVKPTCKVMKFDVMNTMPQPNAWDCGVFALVCATDLAHGRDPVLSEWKLEDMRRHLVECLEKGHVSPFPIKWRDEFHLEVVSVEVLMNGFTVLGECQMIRTFPWYLAMTVKSGITKNVWV